MKYSFILILATALFMVCESCTEHLLTERDAINPSVAVVNWHDSVTLYQEQARWGDGNAYLQLATCYHNGLGVQRDFLMSFSMLRMAEQYGRITNDSEFYQTLPADDPDRLFVEGSDDASHRRYEAAMEKAERLAALGDPHAEFIQGVIASNNDSIDDALRHFRIAADRGCTLASIVINMSNRKVSDWHDWEIYADKLPLLYSLMALNRFENDDATDIEERAARCFRMADERLCLHRLGVHWLLDYYENKAKNGQMPAESAELKRLRTLQQKIENLQKK